MQEQAAVVALSLVYPEADPRAVAELRKLRRLLPVSTAIVVGGRVAESYLSALVEIGAQRITDLASLRRVLEEHRRVNLAGPGDGTPE
jgi:hypothetical protein